jgi:glycerol-3-phosphate cytidylyltransferase-like family protein
MNEDERVECVSHCRYVDEVISNSPWCLTQEFIDKHQIDYVTHGEDLSVDEHGNDAYKWIKGDSLLSRERRESQQLI